MDKKRGKARFSVLIPLNVLAKLQNFQVSFPTLQFYQNFFFPFLVSLLCIQHAVVLVLHTILALKSPLFKGAETFFLIL